MTEEMLKDGQGTAAEETDSKKVEDLIEKSKKTGLSVEDFDQALEEMNYDVDELDKLYEKLDNWKAKVLKIVNKSVNKTSQVSSVEVMKEPFEKTATQKIRRFKYKESAPTVEESKKEDK